MGKISWFFRAVAYRFSALVQKRKIYKKIFINTDKNRYFVFSHGIGDVVWTCCFFKSFLSKQTDYRTPCIVCTKRDIPLIKCFNIDIKVIGLSKNDLIQIGKYCSKKRFSKDVFVCVYPKLKSRRIMLRELYECSRLGLEMDVIYKYGCFNLVLNDRFVKPDLRAYKEQAIKTEQKKKLQKGKTVVLIPYANSRLSPKEDFWEMISETLIKNGYDVYTNVSGENEKPIGKTKELFLPLEELPIVIKEIGCVISCRCGLYDWLFINECNGILVHSYDSNNELSYNLDKKESFESMRYRCGLNSRVFELRIDRNDFSKSVADEVLTKVNILMKS